MTMTYVSPWLFVIGLLVGGVTLWHGTTRAADGDSSKGRALYEKLCVACHGMEGKGDGPMGKALVPPATDFTSAASKKKPVTELQRTIEQGKAGTAMPAWKGQLSSSDITDVVAYLGSLRK
jgi:mono/diheme cytochrome c family protein